MREPARTDTAMLLEVHWLAATLLSRLQRSATAGEWTLNELRVIHALARQGAATAATLCARLCIDAGHLSRIVRRLTAARLVTIGFPGPDEDQRRRPLTATPAGRRALARYERAVERCLARMRIAEEE